MVYTVPALPVKVKGVNPAATTLPFVVIWAKIPPKFTPEVYSDSTVIVGGPELEVLAELVVVVVELRVLVV